MLKYVAIASKHRLCGLASYYSASLDGTLTANGERYHNKRLSAAHLTLPLGSWIEVTSRSTGKKIRCRVNDRGPYVSKFMLDLSYAAAHALGVDVAEDRHVDVRLIALPGEEPLPQEVDWTFARSEEAPAPATTVTALAAK
jgi:rare lipoprotein A